jgi:O-antigen/teichoic acid export membrane protein
MKLMKKNSSLIIKNTFFLYSRMLVTLFVTLYTSRVVLQILGVDDFGIYNVVAGIVILFTFISNSMASAIQRFISFEIGRGDSEKLKKTFSMSLNIHLVMMVFVILICETVGVWFLNNKMVIDESRIAAANWVFQCSLVSLCAMIVVISFNANLIAHEKMSVFAYIGIADTAMKLMVVLLLKFGFDDNLIVYSVLMALVSIITLLISYTYNRLNYSYTKYDYIWCASIFNELIRYIGWNFLGNLAIVLANQGVNILINLFFGPAVNAARGIANQVNAAVSGFVINLNMSVSPQIIKSYAEGEHGYMSLLIHNTSKYSFFLIYIISIPILFNMNTLLNIWLGAVPEYTEVFCKLILIESIVNSLSGPLSSAAQATGKIKLFQIFVGGILLLNLPFSYLLLNIGLTATATFYISISLAIVSLFMRLHLLKKLITFDVNNYIKSILGRVVIIILLSLVIYYLSDLIFTDINVYISLVLSSISLGILLLLCIWMVGLSKGEKIYVRNLVSKKLKFV